MGVLSNLEPQNVFYYFEEITKIPHGSGNVQQISDYLLNFAGQRGLTVIQDELKNVIIIKEASPGYEDEPAVILQGHMDMVAVKKPDCPIDMKTEGLQVAVRGDEIYAEGTSLGGDDGIAVAYALALLDSDSLKHPRLEVVITVDEEVGMDGARGIDLSMLRGHRMINLDSEEEGIFLTSCAGGARVNCALPLCFEKRQGEVLELSVGGLLGGHSGAEIHKERGNSNCLLGRVLYRVAEKLPVSLYAVDGGLADNAIPRETKALILANEKDMPAIQEIVRAVEDEVKTEFATKDPEVYIHLEHTGERNIIENNQTPGEKQDSRERQITEEKPTPCVTVEDTRRAAAFLCALPNGVQAMSADMPGLVETSLNLGILKLADGKLKAEFSVRSSVESAKYALLGKLDAVTALAGGTCQVSGDYPGWKYRKDSPLRDKMVSLYEGMYGTTPKVEAIHAGLECGILGSKISDLDCVSIGPQMHDIHTTEETLSISSTARVWEYLVKLLETKE